MRTPKAFFYTLIFIFLFFFSSKDARSSPPNTLDGKKEIFSYTTNDQESTTYKVFYVGNWFYRLNQENSNWTQAQYLWSKSGNFGTIQFGAKTAKYGFNEAVGDFSNKTFLNYYEDTVTPRTLVGSGTFDLSDYTADEPPFNKFFSGSLESSINDGFLPFVRDYGMTATIYNGAYTISGTSPSKDERWPESGANSLLSLDRDWTVQGSAFTNSNALGISLEADVEGRFQLEVYLGITANSNSIHIKHSVQFDRYDISGYQEQDLSGLNVNSALTSSKLGTFRIRNSANEKTFHLEWLNLNEWININSFNWEIGKLEKNIKYSNTNSSNQLNDWESMESYYFNPQMEFGVPDNLQINLGEYGFTKFSVTEMPLETPAFLPNSLLGKKITISGSYGLDIMLFANEASNAKVKYLDTEAWTEEPYLWEVNGTKATLFLGDSNQNKDKILRFNFNSSGQGNVNWSGRIEKNGESFYELGTGNFSFTDFKEDEIPIAKGWMWFDQYPWVYSNIEQDWLYFYPSVSKLMIYSNKDKAWREMQK